MESALKGFVVVMMVGEEVIVHHVVQMEMEMDKDAVEMDIAMKEHVIVIQDGLVMVVRHELVLLIVLNMVIATMGHAFAKKVFVLLIAHNLLNNSHANVQFNVFEDVYNNAQKFTKPKVLVHPMIAMLNVQRNVFHYVLLEKILIFLVQVDHFKKSRKRNQIFFFWINNYVKRKYLKKIK